MIGWLSGVVKRRDPASGVVILDVNGVGYELFVSIQTLAGVPAEGEPVELWVHTNVREDAITLFGFVEAEERVLFRMLTSVPKVGPRNAVAVLGGFPAIELLETIAAKDSAKLVKIPGIGKKTSEQIVLTLGEKVVTLLELLRAQRGGEPGTQAELLPAEAPDFGTEAREVLLSLGWKGRAVEKALAAVEAELAEGAANVQLDALVRMTLAKLMER